VLLQQPQTVARQNRVALLNKAGYRPQPNSTLDHHGATEYTEDVVSPRPCALCVLLWLLSSLLMEVLTAAG
jgi:hypothetical protein